MEYWGKDKQPRPRKARDIMPLNGVISRVERSLPDISPEPSEISGRRKGFSRLRDFNSERKHNAGHTGADVDHGVKNIIHS
jgi:hypothetical protein